MTFRKVEIQPAARSDLDSYVLWLRAEADIEVAERFARAAISTFDKLAEMPMVGPVIGSGRARFIKMRKWKVDGFPRMLIFYRPSADTVAIIRVLHAAQDWWALLEAE
ncbi:MAG: type II toxin-antitoxin system RelE/ParE family toxin [Sphingomonadaceae bacterium]